MEFENMNNSSAKEIDYLDVDMSLPGQNFVCLSFVSPETVLEKKETYKLKRFIKSLEDDEGNLTIKSKDFEDKYSDFLVSKDQDLETDYQMEIGGANSIRGIKIRGVYNTQDEANKRAESIQKVDRKFNVFVGQVGYWLPWDPNPNNITDQQYLEKGLNDLMQKYNENHVKKDVFYAEQVEARKQAANLEVAKQKQEFAKNKQTENLVDDGTEESKEV